MQGLFATRCDQVLKPREHARRSAVGRGVPDDIILKTAKEIQPDVIVVSKRKGQHLLHSMHGCVAEKILHKATMPVLLIEAPDQVDGR